MPYDPTIFHGTAKYYTHGRPPYSHALVDTVTAELGLDGTGRLLDVGCGPGTLALAFADRFEEAIGLDPDAGMLAEAARCAAEKGVANARWVQALAEEIPDLNLGRFRLVTFGQSYHWLNRERVTEAVYDILEPGGAIALVTHQVDGRPRPEAPVIAPPPSYRLAWPYGYRCPPIPHAEIRAILERYLGLRRRAGRGYAEFPLDSHEELIARTRFGPPELIVCPGRADIIQDVEGVLANYLSMSFAAPHLFGDRFEEFEAEVRALLAARSPAGLFWDWPGDTEVLIARKAG